MGRLPADGRSVRTEYACCSVVRNDAEVLPPVVINNVNLLLPLCGDKKCHFYI